MKLTVNGEEKECQDSMSIIDLLKDLKCEEDHVAVELNSNIVPKSLLSQTILKNNDRLEIVTFVGGG